MPPRPSQEAANPRELQIVDSGWFAADNGMVDFAVKVQNPNKTVEAIDPVIEVVGKDDSGNVIFDETIETPGVLPDSAYYYSYVAGSTADSSANSTEVVKPATVEFSITTPEGSWRPRTRSWLMCTLCRTGARPILSSAPRSSQAR